MMSLGLMLALIHPPWLSVLFHHIVPPLRQPSSIGPSIGHLPASAIGRSHTPHHGLTAKKESTAQCQGVFVDQARPQSSQRY